MEQIVHFEIPATDVDRAQAFWRASSAGSSASAMPEMRLPDGADRRRRAAPRSSPAGEPGHPERLPRRPTTSTRRSRRCASSAARRTTSRRCRRTAGSRPARTREGERVPPLAGRLAPPGNSAPSRSRPSASVEAVSGNVLAIGSRDLAGLAGSVQVALMSRLGERIGVFEALGFSTLLTAVARLRPPRSSLRRSAAGYERALHQPWWMLMGGVMGLLIVFTVTYAGPRIGVARDASGILIAGQLAMGAAIDRWGLFGSEKIALHWPRVARHRAARDRRRAVAPEVDDASARGVRGRARPRRGACSVQGGAAVAKSLFPELGPPGVVFLRLALRLAALWAIARPQMRGRDRADLRLVAALGVVLVSMNLSLLRGDRPRAARHRRHGRVPRAARRRGARLAPAGRPALGRARRLGRRAARGRRRQSRARLRASCSPRSRASSGRSTSCSRARRPDVSPGASGPRAGDGARRGADRALGDLQRRPPPARCRSSSAPRSASACCRRRFRGRWSSRRSGGCRRTSSASCSRSSRRSRRSPGFVFLHEHLRTRAWLAIALVVLASAGAARHRRPPYAVSSAGLMFWLTLKTFSGSYVRLDLREAVVVPAVHRAHLVARSPASGS